ncbi:phosphotransferase enzyme family protein-like protein [Cucurbitaria berberidis CBS 394.84]|uniref:Phosphotransferase enzyme family protein-like protein n=1 Tax=Cucurbitaria berberidis CBS 394.84 TaxID=1168544 RepID=A0A9P4L4B1_9PLEO|nr:phosphotransferase enzyme family protein-like protein [Cucurbitaria berberidis CBS 394.84]KAF1841117.1 phosphotransferase enzyme family protein-like protein [Cucurbitaria berberidis CBS 394.84]
MTAYDEIAEVEADNECRAWLVKALSAKDEIVAFVSSRRTGCPEGEFNGYLRGSFNFCISVRFNDGGPKAIIRFPKPGHTFTARREEKVKSEVQVLEYLREKTKLPVPRVTSWGLTHESPKNLGPFIIMDLVDGTSLTTLLRQPIQSEEDDIILKEDIDAAKLDYVYEQLAEFMIELSRLDFDAIGAIVKNSDTDKWLATERPFTYNMYEMAVTVLNYPVDTFPAAPFRTTKEYLEYQSDENLTHLRVQRNLARNIQDIKRRYIARHRFRQLIPKYCIDNNGPFKLFCDDLQPSNILADPETLKVHAILDWEFTHAMPAQFSSDPPWWLILKGPDMWLENYSMEEFLARYKPRLEQFLRALERVETRSPPKEPKLSTQMRESWKSGRFWFDYGIRKSLDVDDIYWGALHREGDDSLDEEHQRKMEELIETKMKDLEAYDKECKERGL